MRPAYHPHVTVARAGKDRGSERLAAPRRRSYLAASPRVTTHLWPPSAMLVSGRMTREVVTASPGTSLAEGLALMNERRIRHLPVLEDGGVVGIVSDRDLRGAAPPQGSLPEEERYQFLRQHRIGEIMHGEVVT